MARVQEDRTFDYCTVEAMFCIGYLPLLLPIYVQQDNNTCFLIVICRFTNCLLFMAGETALNPGPIHFSLFSLYQSGDLHPLWTTV